MLLRSELGKSKTRTKVVHFYAHKKNLILKSHDLFKSYSHIMLGIANCFILPIDDTSNTVHTTNNEVDFKLWS